MSKLFALHKTNIGTESISDLSRVTGIERLVESLQVTTEAVPGVTHCCCGLFCAQTQCD